MIQVLVGNGWHKVEIIGVGRRGCTVLWKDAPVRVPFARLRWVSANWYDKRLT